MRTALAGALLGSCVLLATRLATASDDENAHPAPRPTVVWILTQLVPSPEIAEGAGTVRFGLRWQVTPLLYSFGQSPRLSPWRAFVVEPIVRQSGSIELFFSPELFVGSFDEPLLRAGVRSYFPVLAKGEEMSVSLATSYSYLSGRSGVGYEIGAYVLYGTLGLQLTYSPGTSMQTWITTFRFRYF